MGAGVLQPPYPHAVHWSPHKPSLRNFGIVKRRRKEKRGRREREKREGGRKNEPPLV